MDDLQTHLRNKRMQILASESFIGDPTAAIKQIKAIVVVIFVCSVLHLLEMKKLSSLFF